VARRIGSRLENEAKPFETARMCRWISRARRLERTQEQDG